MVSVVQTYYVSLKSSIEKKELRKTLICLDELLSKIF